MVNVYEVGRHGYRLDGLSNAIEFVSLELRHHINEMLSADQNLVIAVTLKGNSDVPRFRLSITVFTAGGALVGSSFGPENPSIRRGQ